MDNQEEYVLIKRNSLLRLLKTNCSLSYAVLLLEYLCRVKETDAKLPAGEICRLMDITPRQLSESCRLNRIDKRQVGDTVYYSAFDIMKLTEYLHRRKILKRLYCIPVYLRK